MFRKLLMSMMVIGAVGTTIGAGTFASFNAATTNVDSTFSVGSLVLSNTKPSASACLSTGGDLDIGTADETGGGANAMLCDVLLDVDTKRLGDSITVDLELKNVGNTAGNLKSYATNLCSSAKEPGPDGITGTADDEPFDGQGNLCPAVQVTIQRYTANWAAPDTCVYGGTACAFDPTKTLASFDDYTTTSPLAVASLTPGSSAFLRIGLRLMNGPELNALTSAIVSNTVQGREATFDFSWRLDQS